MNGQGPIGVTGASGEVGGRVARRLADRGLAQRLVVRDAARAPRLPGAEIAIASDYGDTAAMTEALAGLHTLFLVPASEDADRMRLHRRAVDAAVAAGVERVVYLSFLAAAPEATFTFARDHHWTEQHILAAGLEYTFLRASQYLDWVPIFASPDGMIAGPAGEGRVAWVARDDIADVALVTLTDPRHSGMTYDLTGPESHTLRYAAEQLSAFAGRPVTYRVETLEQAYASRASYGAPQFEVDGWVTSYVAVATGELDVVSPTVAELAGHRPQTLPEFLAANPASYAHIASS